MSTGMQRQRAHTLDLGLNSPTTELIIRRGADGRLVTDDSGWQAYVWHVFITRGTESLAFTWRSGAKALDFTRDGDPAFPASARVLENMVAEAEMFEQAGNVSDFADEYGYDDVRRAITVWDGLKRQYTDLERVFGTDLQNFLDTYREKDDV